MALVLSARELVIADEPTTALDVTIQAQILDLMAELKDRLGTAIILITHDLGVIAEMADRVVVMYAGKVVEQAPVTALFDKPLHPYTQGLLRSLPRFDRQAAGGDRDRLSEMPGLIPSIYARREGCMFAPRCPLASDHCREAEPPLETVEGEHRAACWEATP